MHGIVVKVRVVHTQRLKNLLRRVLPERLPAGPLHDHRQQEIAAVRVLVLLAGREVEFLLCEQLQRFQPAESVPRAEAVLPHHPVHVRHAAHMMHHLPNGHRRVAPRHPGQVLPNVVVQTQLPLVSEESYCGRSELLGHRAHVKNGGRRNRDVPIQVGVPVALLVNELAVACDTDRASY